MEVQELKQMIKSSDIPNFLIFIGDEWMVKKIYIEQISKVKKLGIKYIDAVSDIASSVGSKSLFNQNYLYVCTDDKEFMTEEKLQQKVIENLSDNMLILQLTSVDKRLKFTKTYNNSIVEFKTLNEAVLKRYIQKEIKLSDKYTELLMEICDYNYGHCLLEIDKIFRCKDFDIYEDDYMADIAFKKLLEDGTIYVPPKEALWDFIKAVLQNKPKLAFDLYADLKAVEAPTLSILSNLYNNTKQLLQVQTCQSKDIAKTTGLTAWQIKNAKECVGRWRPGDLVYLMRLIQQTESGIKSGKIEESIAVEYILTSLW